MLPGWVHLGRATRAALATWAPEQDCPYVIRLLLKTGMWHHLTSLIPSVDHILLFVIVFPMVKFAFLLKFPSLLFSKHPLLSPDTGFSPVITVRETRVTQLFKIPLLPPSHCPSPVLHLVYTRQKQNKYRDEYWKSKRQKPILSEGETRVI